MSGRRDVTVVIPCFNSSEVIDATLASVAAQSHAPVRVIAVDDRSTDDTLIRIERWRQRLPLEVVQQPGNTGPARARDRGVSMATTELIALLDHDDVWLPDHLATMTALHHTDDDLVAADALRWLPGTALGESRWREERPVPGEAEQVTALVRRNLLFGCSGSLFSRSLYDRAGGFRPDFGGCDDWDLWIRMVRAGAVIRPASHPTVLWRLSRTSLSADDALLEDETAVVRALLSEGLSQGADRAARSTLRHLNARRSLLASYALAREGRSVRARIAALRSLRGRPPVALRAAVMVIAPRRGVLVRDGKRWRPRQWAG